MNILPKKRWHVRTKDNIARVRRDEAQAAEEEKQRVNRAKLAEKESRTAFLRNKARQAYDGGYSDTSRPDPKPEPSHTTTQPNKAPVEADIYTSQGNINFFKDVEEGKDTGNTTNKETEAEKKAEQEKYEKSIGYLTYLGQDSGEAGGGKAWYAQEASMVAKINSDRDNSDPIELGEVGLKSKSRMDPIHDILKYGGFKSNSKDVSNSKNTLKDAVPLSIKFVTSEDAKPLSTANTLIPAVKLDDSAIGDDALHRSKSREKKLKNKHKRETKKRKKDKKKASKKKKHKADSSDKDNRETSRQSRERKNGVKRKRDSSSDDEHRRKRHKSSQRKRSRSGKKKRHRSSNDISSSSESSSSSHSKRKRSRDSSKKRHRSSNDIPSSSENSSSYYRKRNRSRDRKKKRQRSRDYSSDMSSSSESNSTYSSEDEEAAKEKKQKLEILRAERLRREAEESKRAERLLAGKKPDEEDAPKETKLPYKQKYNQQFNPHLARQNQDPPTLQSGVKYWLQ